MPRVPVPFSEYSDTRLDADEQSCVNMFPHSSGGLRQFPGLPAGEKLFRLGYTDGTTFDDSTNFTTAAGGGNLPRLCPQFVDSGDRMVVSRVSGAAPGFLMYTLTTAYDIGSTLALESSHALADTSERPILVGMKDDGTKLLYIDYQDGGVVVTETLTAYDLTDVGTATATTDFSKSNARCGTIHPSGTKLWLVDLNAQIIYEYDVPTPWDVSSISDPSTPDRQYAVDFQFYYMRWNTDGTAYAASTSGGIAYYECSTAYDITTSEFSGFCSVVNGPLPNTAGSERSPNGAPAVAWRNNNNNLIAAKQHPFMDGIENLHIAEMVIRSGSFSGAWLNQGRAYAAFGGFIYNLGFSTSNGVTTISAWTCALNTDSTGGARAVAESDGTNLFVAAGGSYPAVYNFTDGWVELTDAETLLAESVGYIDGRFYVSRQFNDGEFYASNLNDPFTFDALDSATAESSGDAVTRILVVDQLIYFFGERSIEIWQSTGVGRPPIQRIEVIDEVGLLERYAVTVIDNTIYFLDEQKRLVRMRGTQFETLGNPVAGKEWATYPVGNTAIYLLSYTFQQENFVEVSFGDSATWTYHEPSGTWSEREDYQGNAYRCGGYLSVEDAVIGFDRENASAFLLDVDTYQDDEQDMTRTVDTQLITSELYGTRGQELIISGFFPEFEASGAGTVTISIAKNGGSFGNARTVNVTEGTNRYRLHQWGRCREAIFRISTTSNIKLDVLECSADIEAIG